MGSGLVDVQDRPIYTGCLRSRFHLQFDRRLVGQVSSGDAESFFLIW